MKILLTSSNPDFITKEYNYDWTNFSMSTIKTTENLTNCSFSILQPNFMGIFTDFWKQIFNYTPEELKNLTIVFNADTNYELPLSNIHDISYSIECVDENFSEQLTITLE